MTKADRCGTPLLCTTHFEVWQMAYGYMLTSEMVSKYNHANDEKFGACLDRTTLAICNDNREVDVEGTVKAKDMQAHEAFADFGAWTRSALWVIMW